jgi:hypothetical protein
MDVIGRKPPLRKFVISLRDICNLGLLAKIGDFADLFEL